MPSIVNHCLYRIVKGKNTNESWNLLALSRLTAALGQQLKIYMLPLHVTWLISTST
ncbi:hypothetical protein J31TS6_29360 [Brevibacillus reuszeri]|nr:hypothetical protein J31TS6_29360 [Brevibacillus reuszeri]